MYVFENLIFHSSIANLGQKLPYLDPDWLLTIINCELISYSAHDWLQFEKKEIKYTRNSTNQSKDWIKLYEYVV